jgi:hypothetical protein
MIPSESNQYIIILLSAAGCDITCNFYLSPFNHVFSLSFKVHISCPYVKEFCFYHEGSKPTTPNLYVYFWFWLSPPRPGCLLVRGEVVLSYIRKVPCSIVVRCSWYSWYSDSLWPGRSGDRIPVGPRAHSASYTIGTMSFPGVKWPGRGVDHPPHLAPRLESYTSTPPFGLRGLYQGQLYRYHVQFRATRLTIIIEVLSDFHHLSNQIAISCSVQVGRNLYISHVLR